MYRMMIINRDALSIQYLKTGVDWNRYGFELVGEAYNGLDAYSQIMLQKPDVILADIQLHGMNGLELIKKVKEACPNIESIVTSEYAEFVYAQKAINCGVLGYCLKPFDENEIANVLKIAKRSLDRSRKLLENDLLSLVMDEKNTNKEELEELFQSLGFRTDSCWNVAVAVSIGSGIVSLPSGVKTVDLRVGKDKHVCFINCPSTRMAEKWLASADIRGIRGIGLTGLEDSSGSVRQAVEKAETAAYRFFVTGTKGVFLYRDSTANCLMDFSRHLEAANDAKNIVLITNLLAEMEDNFNKGVYNARDAVMLYNTVTSFCFHINPNYRGIYVYSFSQLLEIAENLHGMLTEFEKMIEKIFSDETPCTNTRSANKTFDVILKYVNQNYCEEISLQTLSELFTINTSYLCQLFKKQLNMTFTEYLTKMRISSAIDLLETTNFTIGEISEKVGYADYFYFTRTFKKITGKTPSQYRSLRRVYN